MGRDAGAEEQISEGLAGDSLPLLARDGRTCSYFVDEAGDGTLFDGKGRVLVGTAGCTRHFVLGLAEIGDAVGLGQKLEELRTRLRADPYFSGVPSFDERRGRTAVAFHATDDPPEVRREVYSLLLHHDIRFFAVVRDKRRVLNYVRQRNEREPAYRYSQKELYDSLVRRLFRDRLHQLESYDIWFAKRWKSDRTAALGEALMAARRRFAERFGVVRDVEIRVRPSTPRQCHGLQAVDYLLWAVQRLYEKREDRFLKLVWPLVRLIHDVDDTRAASYGAYYTQDRPLTLENVKNEPEI